MSGVAGLVRWQGDARGDTAMVRRMLDRLSDGTPGRGTVIEDGNLRVGTLKGAAAASRDGRVRLVVDGRIDAPDSPIEDLFASTPDIPTQIVGDFAAIVWWPAERRVVLMRDALGLRPLYYASTPEVCWWATSLAALLATEWLPRLPNAGYYAEYLASAPVSLHESPVVNAWRVPQAHALEVDARGIRLRRYWHPVVDDERAIGERDAGDQFSALLTTAVGACLRAPGIPAFQLSGGLDSSSVVAIARRLGVATPATYSMVFPSVPEADETPYIDAVATHCACASTRVPFVPSSARGLDVFRYAVAHGDLPDIATGEWLQSAMIRRAAADGHGVMLSGLGGDDWLTGSLFHVTDLVRRGRLVAAWRFAAEYRSVPWLDPGWPGLARTALVPLIPDPLKRAWRHWRPAGLAPWLSPSFVAAIDLPARMRAGFDRVPTTRSHVVRESLVRLLSGDSSHAREAQARMGRTHGVEVRHPFLDRRVVEFLLRLPDDLRLRHGQHRYLLRRVMGDSLPPLVANRSDKPDFDPFLRAGLAAVDPDAVIRDRLDIVDRGWVDRAQLLRLWARAQRLPTPGAPADAEALFGVWQALAAEAGLRALSSPQF